MDVIRIFNGLGNQMSQYAFYLAKKKAYPWRTYFITNKYESENIHNGFELNRLFGVRSNKLKELVLYHFLESIYKPVWGYKVFGRFSHSVEEVPNYNFDSRMLAPSYQKGFNFYWGGWHSEKYFLHIREELLRLFRFDESMLNDSSQKWRNIILNDEESCSIHIRRGDFLKDKKWADAISDSYYERAIELIIHKYPNVKFYIFSNDMAWCKEHFKGEAFHFVEGNKGLDAWQDMCLMSKCHHHINANSSFSWWGAWLCTYNDAVTIVPSAFRSDLETNDVYPERWIKL